MDAQDAPGERQNADLVSVIVPVYRVEAFLDDCVKSITDQSYADLEIILVNDGSPDNCPRICDNWAARDFRIRVIHRTNGGLSRARNSGIDVANGKYLTFVDSDDVVAADMMEHLLTCAARSGSEICVAGLVDFYRDPPRYIRDGEEVVLSRELAFLRAFHSQPTWSACGKLFHRGIFDAGVRFKPDLLYEDLEFSPRVFAKASTVSFTPFAL